VKGYKINDLDDSIKNMTFATNCMDNILYCMRFIMNFDVMFRCSVKVRALRKSSEAREDVLMKSCLMIKATI
jgi:hypothetical protein